MNSLSWVHLSDVHFSKALAYDRKRVIETLLLDIKRSSRYHQPDLLFFTGDLAFGEIKDEKINDQLDLGFEFLDEVRKAFSSEISKENCFLVPGNHDVQRSMTSDDQKAHLLACSGRDVQNLIVQKDVTWKRIIERLSEYSKAVRRHGYEHLLHDEERLIFAERRTIRGLKVGIGGFNSAWSCQGNGEHGQLKMASRWQMQHIDSELAGSEYKFALIHHPFEWLHEDEEPSARLREFSRRFQFILHGHEHDDWVTSRDKGHFIGAAAAGYDNSKLKNGYNFATLCKSKHFVRFTFRRYDPQGEDWIANVIANHSDSKGRIRFRLPEEGIDSRPITSNPATRSSTRSQIVKSKHATRFDIFLAVAMAAVDPGLYNTHRDFCLQVLAALKRHFQTQSIYCPLEQLTRHVAFDPPDVALRRGLDAVSSSGLFVMLYREAAASSILVEAGLALSKNIPSIYFVHSSIDLPFLLRAANQALPNLVRVYKYSSLKHLLKIIRDEGNTMYREMAGASKANGFTK